MIVTSTEFKLNLGRYLDLAAREDIVITKNGRRVAKLVAEADDLTAIAMSLIGVIPPDNISADEVKMERLNKRYGISFDA